MESHQVDGKWRGHYTYASNPDAGSSFDALFEDDESILSGDILDDEALGRATLAGTFSFPEIRFTKTYQDIRLVPVEYQGTMSDDGKTMRGRWTLYDRGHVMRGTWHAYRIDSNQEKKQMKAKAVKEKTEGVF